MFSNIVSVSGLTCRLSLKLMMNQMFDDHLILHNENNDNNLIGLRWSRLICC